MAPLGHTFKQSTAYNFILTCSLGIFCYLVQGSNLPMPTFALSSKLTFPVWLGPFRLRDLSSIHDHGEEELPPRGLPQLGSRFSRGKQHLQHPQSIAISV